jgi:ATP-dependent DNA helicase RecQ
MLENDGIKLVYLTPERFFKSKKADIERVKMLRPSYLIIDEAHCIDRWGKDFRPSYGRLGEVRSALGNPPVLAFTASAGIKAQKRILSSLRIDDAEQFVHGVDRPNIVLLRYPCAIEARYKKISELLQFAEANKLKVMVFVPTVKVGEAIQSNLNRYNLLTEFYHSKMGRPHEREFLLKRFTGEISPSVNRIICTNAFGMGLDVPDVRIVVHWQHPASVEDYLQEFGRAGRDGKPAAAILFRDLKPKGKARGLWEFMAKITVDKVDGTAEDKKAIYSAKMEYLDDIEALSFGRFCPRSKLIEYFLSGIRVKKNIGFRIIEWIFATRKKQAKSRVCCDFHMKPRKQSATDPIYAGSVRNSVSFL